MGVAAFQKSLLTNLGDKTSIGEIWLQDGRLQTSPGLNLGWNTFFTDDDPLLPKAGEKRTVASAIGTPCSLSWAEGVPEFEAYSAPGET